jgi:hypothetical protein
MKRDMQERTSEKDDVAQEVAREERLQAFGSSLAVTRDKWITARASQGWDKRVTQDLDQYHGKDPATRMAASMMESVYQGYPVTTREALPTRSTVFVGITRQKANSAEARLSDILLPTDDRNWGIQPTPDPDCATALQSNETLIDPATGQPVLFDEEGNVTDDPQFGRPAKKKQIALAVQQTAGKAAEAMENEINDQLIECDYNGEVRKVLHDAAVMGVGVIKGPMVTARTRKAWREKTTVNPETGQPEKVQILQVVDELKPASFRVDPRRVWEDPACGDNVKNGRGIFEMEDLTERQVRELAKQPGYLKDQLRKVIQEGPKRSAALYEVQRAEREKEVGDDGKTFQHWIYWGELNREELKSAKVDMDDEGDELASVSGCVEMINDVVVRAYLNPLEDDPIPYDFYPWEKVTGTPRGYGIPYLMRAQQSVTNAAWRMMMDNMGVTSGPQIVIKRGAVTPADGQWTLTPRKFWYLTDDSIDVSKVFAAVEFNNHQGELAAVIDLAEKLADQETATPMMTQGQQGSAPETVGGMQMLMNSANVVLRRLVKQFDDYVTRPHIRRYYDYNMAYGERDEIKGDFAIDARGSSALIVRDIQNQAFTNLLAMGANPVYAPMIDTRKLFEKALKAQHLDPRDVLLTPEQIEARQAQQPPPPPDPRIEAAKITAEARMMEAQAVAAGRAAETEARSESEGEHRRLRMMELQLKHDLQVMQMAQMQQMSIQQVKAQLAQTALNDRTKKELAASEMMFKEKHSPDGQGI